MVLTKRSLLEAFQNVLAPPPRKPRASVLWVAGALYTTAVVLGAAWALASARHARAARRLPAPPPSPRKSATFEVQQELDPMSAVELQVRAELALFGEGA